MRPRRPPLARLIAAAVLALAAALTGAAGAAHVMAPTIIIQPH